MTPDTNECASISVAFLLFLSSNTFQYFPILFLSSNIFQFFPLLSNILEFLFSVVVAGVVVAL